MEIFRKDVTYNNIKSHQKKTGPCLFCVRHIFGKTTLTREVNHPPQNILSVKISRLMLTGKLAVKQQNSWRMLVLCILR